MELREFLKNNGRGRVEGEVKGLCQVEDNGPNSVSSPGFGCYNKGEVSHLREKHVGVKNPVGPLFGPKENPTKEAEKGFLKPNQNTTSKESEGLYLNTVGGNIEALLAQIKSMVAESIREEQQKMEDCILAQEQLLLSLKQSTLNKSSTSEREDYEGPIGENLGSHLPLINYCQGEPEDEDAQTVFVDCPSDSEGFSDEPGMQLVQHHQIVIAESIEEHPHNCDLDVPAWIKRNIGKMSKTYGVSFEGCEWEAMALFLK
uniref:Uncharacterized protein n=1 Tax=Nicotiana tabacum TaxID=4097 RepID=A0A1S4B5V8_TOBAC|nr:PREDICTED: uncharacterized protein LOC107804899 [Nicotiana tabacum]